MLGRAEDVRHRQSANAHHGRAGSSSDRGQRFAVVSPCRLWQGDWLVELEPETSAEFLGVDWWKVEGTFGCGARHGVILVGTTWWIEPPLISLAAVFSMPPSPSILPALTRIELPVLPPRPCPYLPGPFCLRARGAGARAGGGVGGGRMTRMRRAG